MSARDRYLLLDEGEAAELYLDSDLDFEDEEADLDWSLDHDDDPRAWLGEPTEDE